MDDRNNYVDCSYICPERSFLVQLFLSERKKAFEPAAANAGPVSYTHLDVYKRQVTYIRGKDGGIQCSV